MQGPGNGGMPAPNLAEETDPHVQTEPRKLTPTSAGIFPTLLDIFGTRQLGQVGGSSGKKRGDSDIFEDFKKNGLCMPYGSSVRMRHKVYIIPILLNC